MISFDFINISKIQYQENTSKFFTLKTNDFINEKSLDIKFNSNSIPFADDDESLYNNTLDFEKNKIINFNLFFGNDEENKLEKKNNKKDLIFKIEKKRKKKNICLTLKKSKFILFKNKLLKKQIFLNKDNKFFPFNKPNRIINYYLPKFNIKQIGKNNKFRKRRKYKADDIRKKIKSRFFKQLKNIINQYLIISGSKKLIDFLPPSFISNLSKPLNYKYMNSTYKELLSTDFKEIIQKKNNVANNLDYKRFLKNKTLINYLEENQDISKLSGFNIIKDIKCKDLFERYLNSKEFEDSILRLKDENENSEYINKYIISAKDYVGYYNNY